MSGAQLPRNKLDFSTTAPALFYLGPYMAVACRVIQPSAVDANELFKTCWNIVSKESSFIYLIVSTMFFVI
jgi:hypothetical protein